MGKMFPSSTIKFIEAEAASLRENAHSLEELVDGIYARVEKLEYGVEEALSGFNHFRYPDQIEKQANCAEATVFIYLLAKHAGLNPLVLRLVDIDHRGPDHLSTIIPDGKEYGEEYIIVDTFYRMKGNVELYPDHLSVQGRIIEASDDGCIYECRDYHFSALEVLSEEKLISHIDMLNSPDGFFMYLMGSQKIGVDAVYDGLVTKFISYNEELNSLELTLAHKSIFSFYTVLRFNLELGQLKKRTADLYLADGFDWNREITPFFHASYDYASRVEELVSQDALPVSPAQEEQLMDYLLYWSFERKKDSSGELNNLVYTAEERQRFLDMLPESVEKPGHAHLKPLLEYFESEDMRYLKETHPVLYNLSVDYRLSLVGWGDKDMSPDEKIRMLLENEGLNDVGKMAQKVAETVKDLAIMPVMEEFLQSKMFSLVGFFTMVNSNSIKGLDSLFDAVQAAYQESRSQ